MRCREFLKNYLLSVTKKCRKFPTILSSPIYQSLCIPSPCAPSLVSLSQVSMSLCLHVSNCHVSQHSACLPVSYSSCLPVSYLPVSSVTVSRFSVSLSPISRLLSSDSMSPVSCLRSLVSGLLSPVSCLPISQSPVFLCPVSLLPICLPVPLSPDLPVSHVPVSLDGWDCLQGEGWRLTARRRV